MIDVLVHYRNEPHSRRVEMHDVPSVVAFVTEILDIPDVIAIDVSKRQEMTEIVKEDASAIWLSEAM